MENKLLNGKCDRTKKKRDEALMRMKIRIRKKKEIQRRKAECKLSRDE